MGEICDEYKADFNMIQEWNVTYNDSYKKLGKENVTRPILTRIPESNKKIGGHCVVSNAIILKKMLKNFLPSEYILKYS